jgi:hypothetical protein
LEIIIFPYCKVAALIYYYTQNKQFMSMKVVFGIALQVLWALAAFCSGGGGKIKADGKADEWSMPLRFSKSGSGINYDISSDSAGLYFVLQSSDAVTIMRLVNNGFEIYIDTTGKKKKSVSVLFPLKSEEGFSPGDRRKRDGNAEEKMRLRIQSDVKVMQVSGFKGIANGGIALPNDKGIDAALVLAEGNILTMELAIPLKYLKAKLDTNIEWSIGMKLNMPEKPEGMGSGIMGGPGGSKVAVDGPTGGSMGGNMGSSSMGGPMGSSSQASGSQMGSFAQQGQGQDMGDEQAPGMHNPQNMQRFFEPVEWRFKIKVSGK